MNDDKSTDSSTCSSMLFLFYRSNMFISNLFLSIPRHFPYNFTFNLPASRNRTPHPPQPEFKASSPENRKMNLIDRLPTSTLPLSLQHFLKFSAETIKREAMIESSPLGADGLDASGSAGSEGQTVQITVAGGETEIIPDVVEEAGGEPGVKPKRKKKYKKKPPKPKKPKPGQVSEGSCARWTGRGRGRERERERERELANCAGRWKSGQRVKVRVRCSSLIELSRPTLGSMASQKSMCC
jgi:hypothetical protein